MRIARWKIWGGAPPFTWRILGLAPGEHTMIESTFITVGNYKLHVLAAGAGPTVLLLHGFGASAQIWRPTVELLARAGYMALAVDALGFGLSEKPLDAPYSLQLQADLYVGLLDTLGVEHAAMVAHSMGGKYALATALLHPRRVSGLALAGSDGFVAPMPMDRSGSIPGLAEMLLALSAHPTLTRAMLHAAFVEPERHVTSEMIAHAREAIGSITNRRVLAALSARYAQTDLRSTGLRARLTELRAPTLLVWGESDRVFKLENGEQARREIPSARLVVIPRCGHFPQIEAARQFHGLVLGFLAAHAPRMSRTV